MCSSFELHQMNLLWLHQLNTIVCFMTAEAKQRHKGNNLGWTHHPFLPLHNIKHIICISFLMPLFAAKLAPHFQGTFPPLPSSMLSLDLSLIKCMKTSLFWYTVYYSSNDICISSKPEAISVPYFISIIFSALHFFTSMVMKKLSIMCLWKCYHLKTHKCTDIAYWDIN